MLFWIIRIEGGNRMNSLKRRKECDNICQYAHDVAMEEHMCFGECKYKESIAQWGKRVCLVGYIAIAERFYGMLSSR